MSRAASKASICANNNADWYEAIFRSHGLAFARDHANFRSFAPAPPYYSQLTTLSATDTAAQLAAIDALDARLTGQWSIKDGFNTLDLRSRGFSVLFEAEWIWHDAKPASMPPHWSIVSSPAVLAEWELVWKQTGSPTEASIFRAPLLTDEQVTLLALKEENHIIGGCAANRSPDCIGLSNLFNAPFDEALSAIQNLAPDLPVVGYESDEALKTAKSAGFSSVGPLRIWIK